MGVPAFYRWLTEKYPKIVVDAKEEKADEATGAVDATARNPNEFEFDNLYLDMNGCIHPCFHPDDGDLLAVADLPTTFEDVFSSVFRYIDRIFNIVRPRKLLYLAIDGVAPRAKMNQQRARRFQTARTKEIAEEEENRLRREYERNGKKVLPQVQTMVDDSNVITPGTEFMFELSKALQVYIITRIRDNPAWGEIKVILSDANVPGEGEHKIMSFIRSQRTLPGYNPNTRHCLYGLDADLIMLALATHELHFSILREEVLTVKDEQPLSISASISSFQNANDLSGTPKSRGWFKPFDQTNHQKVGSSNSSPFPVKKTCKYQFLHVWILREYLEHDLHLSSVPDGFTYDFERAVDDFIFMCFFVGNDFLPHMPTLEIHEGAIDLLMHVYKRDFKSLGGYLVDTQRVNERNAAYIKLSRVEKFILTVGNYEELIFAKRTRMKERRMRRILNDLSDSLRESNIGDDEETSACVGSIPLPIPNLSIELNHSDMVQNTKELKEELKRILKERSDTFSGGSLGTDKVKFGLPGWKERYYKEKFSADNPQELESIRKSIVKEYTEGLCWVLLYYFSGVPSWTWFYPYHYGPCASDLRGLSQVKVNFQMGLPFTPFDQLMAVLPPTSAHALPRAYRDIMTDPCSVLQSFYPIEFSVDVDGKRYLWQGICLLPFIDEKMLLPETNKVASKIQDYEAERNAVKIDKVFVAASSKFGSQIQSLFLNKSNEESRKRCQCIEMSLSVVDSIAGSFNLSDVLQQRPSGAEKMVLCLNYELPRQREIVQRLLAGVNLPEKSVYASDIDGRMLWHEHHSHRPVSRMPRQNSYPKTESGENSQYNRFCGRGWSPQGRGRGGAPPFYSATTSTGNSFSRVSDSGVSGPRTYIPPHLRNRTGGEGASVRPVAPFQHRSQQGSLNMMWAPRPAYSVGTNYYGSGSGRGFVSNNEFGGHRPIYNNQRGRGRGYISTSATN